MKHYHQGSGLLFTVLTLALFTTLSLVTIRSLIGSSRTASLVQISKDADSEARQGLAEGMLWASSNTTNDSKPIQFRKQDTNCAFVSASLQTTEPSHVCPYYGFSVWRHVIVASPLTSYQFPINAIMRASNNSIAISVNGGSSNITLTNTSAQAFSYNVTGNCSGACTNSSFTSTSIATFTFSDATAIAFGQGANVIVPSAGGGINIKTSINNTQIDRGFTTIASTGYVGGVVRRRFANIYQGDSSNYEYESSDDIDANGCLVGYKDSTNPNDSSTCYSQRSDGTP